MAQVASDDLLPPWLEDDAHRRAGVARMERADRGAAERRAFRNMALEVVDDGTESTTGKQNVVKSSGYVAMVSADSPGAAASYRN